MAITMINGDYSNYTFMWQLIILLGIEQYLTVEDVETMYINNRC